eukprot:1540994-Prymnesium_polylepis.1
MVNLSAHRFRPRPMKDRSAILRARSSAEAKSVRSLDLPVSPLQPRRRPKRLTETSLGCPDGRSITIQQYPDSPAH